MLWLLIALWFLPPLMFLTIYLVGLLTGIGGRHRKVVLTGPTAACSCTLNVTDTSAATPDAARGPRWVGHTGLPHQPGDTLAAYVNVFGRKLGIDARCIISATPMPRVPRGCPQSVQHRSRPDVTAAASPMRGSRWGRHPAAGTWWRSDSSPGDRLRTGTPRWDRVRLPSEPGRRL